MAKRTNRVAWGWGESLGCSILLRVAVIIGAVVGWLVGQQISYTAWSFAPGYENVILALAGAGVGLVVGRIIAFLSRPRQ
jgi:hypothetical protein